MADDAPDLSPDAGGELPAAPADRVRALLEELTRGFGVEATVEVAEDDDEIRASVEGDDVALLIGKHGSTIDAIQQLAARFAFRGGPGVKAVAVDVAGYRSRREATLRRAADQAVSDALSFGRAVELEPMSSPERRIVHEYLRDRTDVQTHSEGDEPDRRLVVSPLRST